MAETDPTHDFVEMSRIDEKTRQDTSRNKDVNHASLHRTTQLQDDVHSTGEIHLLPKGSIGAIRMTMTLLFIIVVPAATLTVFVASQYRLLIATFWAILLFAFAGLVWFVQSDLLRNRSRVFHPYIHSVADAIVTECENFAEDWRTEYLMLTEGQQNDAPEPGVEETSGEPRARKPKSVLFRALVKPWLPLVRRRRRRRSRQQKRHQVDAYVPPDDLLNESSGPKT